MECEEADVLEMIYNISFFSEEKNDKLDDVWFIHVSLDEGKKILESTACFSLPEAGMWILHWDWRWGLLREMPRETLINRQTFGSWLGEGNYASIVAVLSSLFHGSTPPGDKCVNYYISIQDLSCLPPPLLVLAPGPSLQLILGQQ